MESGLRATDPSADAGGLIVMVRPDPADVARTLANDLRAELAIGGEETERAVARLRSRELEHRDLDGLAAAMRRAEGIRDRTRATVSERLSKVLNNKIAIHPDTIRRAASELLAAELALADAEALDQRRMARGRRARIGGGASAAAVGGAVGALAVPVAGAVVAAAGVLGATALQRRASKRPPAAHASLRAHCAVSRARWEQVAGVGADPAEVDRIVHRYDPQDRIVADLVGENPAVRAAERVVVERRLAWVSAWRREVGDATPIADPAMRDVLQRDRTELWLTSGTALAADEADTLVVAAPYADLPEARARDLHRRLLGLPRGTRVIVVLAPDPDAPTGASIPGVGWVPGVAPGR